MVKNKEPFYVTAKHQTLWIITTAFAIAAALFWKDTITQIINTYIPTNQSVEYSIFASVVVTVIGIIAAAVAYKTLKD